MKSAHGVELEDKLDQLRELDKQILDTSLKGAELIHAGAHPDRVGVEIDYLRTLWRRRDIVLHELKKQGRTERELYFREAPHALA